MKKVFLIISCAAIAGCSKPNSDKQQDSGNTVLWAETSESYLPMIQDSMWSKLEWDKVYKVDKEKIFKTVVSAVLNGKLKAYGWYPEKEMTVETFKKLLDHWDSTHVVDDINNPGTMILAPIKVTITHDDIAEIRMDEKMEFDTVSNTLIKKVNVLQFIGFHYDAQTGNINGKKKLFDVKLGNDADNKPKN
jgi:Cu/Ag efflux protein CusF